MVRVVGETQGKQVVTYMTIKPLRSPPGVPQSPEEEWQAPARAGSRCSSEGLPPKGRQSLMVRGGRRQGSDPGRRGSVLGGSVSC